MPQPRLSARASLIGLSSLALGVLVPQPLTAQDLRESSLVQRLRNTARQLLEEDRKLGVRVEDADADEEVAIVGVVRIAVPMGHALDQVRRVERLFAHSPFVAQVGAIADARAPHELSQLRLSEAQAELLTRCEVGSCKFKLPRPALMTLDRVDWSEHEDITARAADLLAGFLADCLADYLAAGDSRLPVYRDKREPLAAAVGHEALLRSARTLFEHDEALSRHLRSGPEPPPGGESRFFWIVEDYGLRPVITVNQAIVRSGAGAAPEWGRVVMKQIYGSHYLQAAIRAIDLVTVPDSDGRELWVTLHGRFRFDKELGVLARGLIERRLESVWEDQLRAVYAYLVSTHKASLVMKEAG